MTNQYYEAHVTMLGDPVVLRPMVEEAKWKFSAIDGDANLGDGIKCYATTQLNVKLGAQGAIDLLDVMGNALQRHGVEVIRRKVELVIYDDRSDKVKPCDGDCATCQEAR